EGKRYSTPLKPASAAAWKRSRKGTSLNSMVRLALNLGIASSPVVGCGRARPRGGGPSSGRCVQPKNLSYPIGVAALSVSQRTRTRQKHFLTLQMLQFRLTHRVTPSINTKPIACQRFEQAAHHQLTFLGSLRGRSAATPVYAGV